MSNLAIRISFLVMFASFSCNCAAATCTGSPDCAACKNCSSCKHCSKDGGSCGVCASKKAEPAPATAKTAVAPATEPKPEPAKAEAVEWRTVARVVDGDTLELDAKGGEKVRLIGVDTPEKYESAKLEKDAERSEKDKATIKALGEKSSAFAKSLCEGKKVRLEYDGDRRDKYGRTLAYVILEDGKCVNVEIIRAGYGSAYTAFPFKRMDEFRKLDREAREAKCGLWADDSAKTEAQK